VAEKKGQGEEKVIKLTEGTIKKGGVNPEPSNPRPNVRPVAQNPPPKEEGKNG